MSRPSEYSAPSSLQNWAKVFITVVNQNSWSFLIVVFSPCLIIVMSRGRRSTQQRPKRCGRKRRRRRRRARFRQHRLRAKHLASSISTTTQITIDAFNRLHLSSSITSLQFIERDELTRHQALSMPVEQRPMICFLRSDEQRVSTEDSITDDARSTNVWQSCLSIVSEQTKLEKRNEWKKISRSFVREWWRQHIGATVDPFKRSNSAGVLLSPSTISRLHCDTD